MPILPDRGVLRHGRQAPPAISLLWSALALLLIGGCSTAEEPPSSSPSVVAPTVAALSQGPSPSPSPTPLPTPRYTNQPDPSLEALIPARIAGAVVQKPAPTEYGVTPGDIGSIFGDLGLRFRSLVIAYVERPRLSLYAVDVDAPPVQTAELRPFLAAAGQYVGINGLHPEAWHSAVVGRHLVWTRGDDPATLRGTTLYCWSAGRYIFLLIGSSDAANRAMVTALPGEAPPSPTPLPASPSTAASSTPAPSGATSSATPS